jgi:hypothetical protein
MIEEHKPYGNAVSTDVMKTWRKHGFVPPSELPEYQEKWNYFKSLAMMSEEKLK